MNAGKGDLHVSVIIPCWDDDEMLASRIAVIRVCPGVCEVLVVAVGPARFSSSHCRVIESSEPNRGRQLDLGARAARGDVLVFLHADTEFTGEHSLSLVRAMKNPDLIGGGFFRKFDERHPGLTWLEPWERLHSKWFGTIYGDQSMFVRRSHYEKIGGFRDYPLLEDVEFSTRLRRSGEVALLDPPVRTSARRHLAQGPWRTTLRNMLFLALYRLGVSPRTIHGWYYSAHSAREPVKDSAISLSTPTP